ncbi:hypothetical protein BGZ54_009758, partial [Gamsiella multidivaricata]
MDLLDKQPFGPNPYFVSARFRGSHLFCMQKYTGPDGTRIPSKDGIEANAYHIRRLFMLHGSAASLLDASH